MANKKKILLAVVAVAVVAVIVAAVLLAGGNGANAPVSTPATGMFDAAPISHEEPGLKLGKADAEGFTLLAENKSLRISMDLSNLALKVEDLAGGNVYYSYADNDRI